jgi:hypothetical protein
MKKKDEMRARDELNDEIERRRFRPIEEMERKRRRQDGD